MIGELKRKEADLAAASLTVTAIRKGHIDYTYPFLVNSLSILMKKSSIYGNSSEVMFGLSYFLTPFSAGVWMLIIVSFLTVSLGFILLNLLNPYEWRQRVQRGELKDPEETDDHFGVKESLWFSFSTLVMQGYGKRPLSVAGRTLAVFWMFFIILTFGSYIALMVRNPNLVVNTNAGRNITVTGLRSFSKPAAGPITTLGGGSTRAFFSNNKIPMYVKVYQNMKKTGFATNTAEGIDMVKTKGAAFVLETASANYVVNRDCDLTVLANDFSDRHYAFALRKNDELRHKIDEALLELTESGEIARLRYVWWRVKSPIKCRGTRVLINNEDTGVVDSIMKTSGLGLQAFGGPLIFLLIGLIITALTCVVEILVFKHYDKSPGVPFSGDKENERA